MLLRGSKIYVLANIDFEVDSKKVVDYFRRDSIDITMFETIMQFCKHNCNLFMGYTNKCPDQKEYVCIGFNILTFKNLNLPFFTIFQYNIYIFILLFNASMTLFNISLYFFPRIVYFKLVSCLY